MCAGITKPFVQIIIHDPSEASAGLHLQKSRPQGKLTLFAGAVFDVAVDIDLTAHLLDAMWPANCRKIIQANDSAPLCPRFLCSPIPLIFKVHGTYYPEDEAASGTIPTSRFPPVQTLSYPRKTSSCQDSVTQWRRYLLEDSTTGANGQLGTALTTLCCDTAHQLSALTEKR